MTVTVTQTNFLSVADRVERRASNQIIVLFIMIVHFTINQINITWDEEDLDVYYQLMNNDDFRYQFFENAIRSNKLKDFGLFSFDADDLRITRHSDIPGNFLEVSHKHNSEYTNTFAGTQQEHREITDYVIWSTRKQTTKNLEATELLLNLREKYAKEFNDRKTTKSSICKKIGEKIASAGLILEAIKMVLKNAGKSLQICKRHIFHSSMSKDWRRKKDPPPFFDKMHSIFGSKVFINPKYIFDSEVSNTSTLDLELTSDVTYAVTETRPTSHQTEERRAESSTDTRFKTVKSTPKPTREDKLIVMVKECHKQTISSVNYNSKILLNEIKKQNNLIEHQNVQRLIDLFSEMVQAFKKPRTK